MSQMLSVTPSVGRQSLGHVFAGAITCCDPEIALALFVFYSGKAAGLLACYEARSKGRAKRLLEREALAFCRGTDDKRNSQCAQRDHTRHYLYLI